LYKEEALDYTLQRTHIGRGYGSVIRETREWVKLVCDGLNSAAPECIQHD